MTQVRNPAVAGTFYPGDAGELRRVLRGFLADAAPEAGRRPKALVVPHAGYIYSGTVAASAYATLRPYADAIRRVALFGPAHTMGFVGLATSGADFFSTPLGDIPLDREIIARLELLPQVRRLDQAHALEHSLEVQLPFLQETLRDFTLVPIVAGDTGVEAVAEVIAQLWGGDETLILISSDLSHYLDYATASKMDRATSEAIEALDGARIGAGDACGRVPLRGFLQEAHQRALRCQTLDQRNSGDTAGPKDRVVGYGSYLFWQEEVGEP
ncbi:AmmeMemoRadiSam system protein B [Biformimicrobium ophioploci]|uniref:MEMO1 family protein MNKW57_12780 n=1 Tax=Biformimicrobium ophioploci TaxID=3036711 RepID=A0ABQ6LXX9_9GAMM|nr:AmmeMemoRadiSam system protein B [Microbulbifer sp. NKW57]GMG86957.1 hypothetical protein MNKW57_12780 [Microbulbifer sp. NKW57]